MRKRLLLILGLLGLLLGGGYLLLWLAQPPPDPLEAIWKQVDPVREGLTRQGFEQIVGFPPVRVEGDFEYCQATWRDGAGEFYAIFIQDRFVTTGRYRTPGLRSHLRRWIGFER